MRSYIEFSVDLKVCNIGIGTGEWDDYLGYLLAERTVTGTLTSIDSDSDICTTFWYRQIREGHPNPSHVICDNILSTTIAPEQFDVVTLIGSAMTEVGQYEQTLQNCFRILKHSGVFMYMDFLNTNHLQRATKWLEKRLPYLIEKVASYERYPNISFFIMKIVKR